jgi:glycosyltransferase involved in cell wall biosynthesis
MALISVIIPTFNRPLKTLRAVTSVLYQTYRDFEIIIVDDGSDQISRNALRPLRPYITYISHEKNRGVSASRNTGLKSTKSPFVAFLDSDDYWLPHKLSAQIAFFDRNPGAVACQTNEVWIRQGKRVNPKNRHLKPSGDIFEPSLKLCLISPSAVMLKRSLLNEVGIFDEDLPVCEDYDLWLRITCRYPVHLIDQDLVIKTGGHDDQLSSSRKGMDRYRIMSLVKLIGEGSLDERQSQAVIQELKVKCKIYGQGCLRRTRLAEGSFYLQLPEMIQREYFNGLKKRKGLTY